MSIGLAVVLAALALGEISLGNVTAVVVAPAALIVAAVRLRAPLAGPQIHDRELDIIVGAGAILATVALLIGQVVAPERALGLLAAAPALVAVLALAAGTRRLWQARAVPTVAALGWVLPWQAIPSTLPYQLTAAAAVAIAALVVARR